MPKPNQRTITVRKDTYERGDKKAKKLKKSMARFVTDLIDQNTVELKTCPKEA